MAKYFIFYTYVGYKQPFYHEVPNNILIVDFVNLNLVFYVCFVSFSYKGN
jgi:hypothetical protein